MLADLESSVLEHQSVKRDARRFSVDPSVNWGDIYIYLSSDPWLPKRNSRRFGIHESVDSHTFIACSNTELATYLRPFLLIP
jgi:hypothetical protein